ncbi:MAG: glycosyltransferase family protein [Planctomycetaceae bacterium]
MARIVYGVSGEGSGHSSRAREIGRHIQSCGHTLKLVSYDRGYRNLCDEFDVFETEGLSIASHDNRVSIVQTFTDNLRRLPQGHRKLQELRQRLFVEFNPDCVITDFEPMTAYLANHYDLPLVTVDNQHRMRYVEYECPERLKLESRLTRGIVRAMVPRPDVSLATVFAFDETTNDRTFLFPPILRSEVLERTPVEGDHLLVYLTDGFESFVDQLKSFGRETFHVYGSGRAGSDGCLTYCPFSRDGFLNDLASARAVLATAGFTLISESLYLRKPYLALPMQGQFEQQLNGFQLQRLGYGVSVDEPSDSAVSSFLYHLPDYRQRLAAYPGEDNSAILAKLDALLADDCAEARRYHERR